MSIEAVQQIRKMRGKSQSHLMLAEDGNLYVVKFQNNPQHLRILANEWLATTLAQYIGLRVPDCQSIFVGSWLSARGLESEIGGAEAPRLCQAGLHYGSLFVGGLTGGHVVDYLPDSLLPEVRNLDEFWGMLAFDLWTDNVDNRQAVFHKTYTETRYTATFIDHGDCFGGGSWDLSDIFQRGTFLQQAVYGGMGGWAELDPWLKRIEAITVSTLEEMFQTVPPEWYGFDHDAIYGLLSRLLARRAHLRRLIDNFGKSLPSHVSTFKGCLLRDLRSPLMRAAWRQQQI